MLVEVVIVVSSYVLVAGIGTALLRWQARRQLLGWAREHLNEAHVLRRKLERGGLDPIERRPLAAAFDREVAAYVTLRDASLSLRVFGRVPSLAADREGQPLALRCPSCDSLAECLMCGAALDDPHGPVRCRPSADRKFRASMKAMGLALGFEGRPK